MRPGLSSLDWFVLGFYFLLVTAVGFRVARGQRSTRDYFLGGRSLPWWAAALSIIATETSAVTYIGVPAGAFGGDWSVLQLVAGFILGRFFLAFVFVRVFFRREYLTVYGYLGDRFGPWTRLVASLCFLLGRLVASGVRLYAGCLAFGLAVELPLREVILALGVLGTLFTLAGGIRSVVWTDVILGATLIAGGLASAAWLLQAIPGGLEGVLSSPELAAKTRVVKAGWSPGDAGSLTAGLLGGFALTLATHGTDQDVAQRMLTCRDARSGSWSLAGSALLIGPLFALFLAVGTLLWFYHRLGDPPYALPEDTNRVFPLFIVSALPPGVAGLVLAGLLAAALSSYTSVLNALASTSVGDLYRPLAERLAGPRDERHFLRASRWITALWAAGLMGAAIAFTGSRENILELGLKALNYTYGAVLGVFLLGICTPRGRDGTAVAGMLLSVPLVGLLQLRQWAGDPSLAPGWLAEWIAGSPRLTRWLLETVPDVAWPYWVVLGAAVTVAAGALGSARPGGPGANNLRSLPGGAGVAGDLL